MSQTKAPLTKGMFGRQFSPVDARFDIYCGQLRGHELSHNGGWYNRQGEKLGYGDLDANDFRRIARDLDPGEVFIVLSESDSFWNFVTGYVAVGALCTTKPDVEAPGIDYVIEHARFVITRGRVMIVRQEFDPNEPTRMILGLTCTVILRGEAERIVRSSTA